MTLGGVCTVSVAETVLHLVGVLAPVLIEAGFQWSACCVWHSLPVETDCGNEKESFDMGCVLCGVITVVWQQCCFWIYLAFNIWWWYNKRFKAGPPPPPLEAILVIFGHRALIFFFLFESSWKKMKNDTTFVRMRSGDHLGDAKMSKMGTSLRRIYLFY